jgi:hypothetical protein
MFSRTPITKNRPARVKTLGYFPLPRRPHFAPAARAPFRAKAGAKTEEARPSDLGSTQEADETDYQPLIAWLVQVLEQHEQLLHETLMRRKLCEDSRLVRQRLEALVQPLLLSGVIPQMRTLLREQMCMLQQQQELLLEQIAHQAQLEKRLIAQLKRHAEFAQQEQLPIDLRMQPMWRDQLEIFEQLELSECCKTGIHLFAQHKGKLSTLEPQELHELHSSLLEEFRQRALLDQLYTEIERIERLEKPP